jgi:predicted Zn-dependent protease with MMP-like domain
MAEHAEEHDEQFAGWVREALASLPPELAERVENVELEVSDEEPDRPGVLGLYRGIPLTGRGRGYVFVLPDRITIYRRPLERAFGHDRQLLEKQVRHVVLHELAHHFGISDERLRELGRY